ncbi:NUDIX hydrolase [Paenibacillus hodogayensis]|uniref:NUDIX hydrolase n=1 Tax=Paenibacillus hodogayensis TaxID=279208 RepID=A0ABV5VW64_9BACL
MEELWHRHLGVYGICVHEGKILLINKKGGPYTNRYDLPGGTVEPNEPLVNALHRELKEETGISIKVIRNLGVLDYVIPYKLEKRGTTHIHHIAIYYEVEYLSGELTYCTEMHNNDSVGSEWVGIGRLFPENSSPLVLQALEWLKDKNNYNFKVARLDSWMVKQ